MTSPVCYSLASDRHEDLVVQIGQLLGDVQSGERVKRVFCGSLQNTQSSWQLNMATKQWLNIWKFGVKCFEMHFKSFVNNRVGHHMGSLDIALLHPIQYNLTFIVRSHHQIMDSKAIDLDEFNLIFL